MNMNIQRKWILMVPMGLLASCASYHPLPLQPMPKLSHTLQSLQTDSSQHRELPPQWRNKSVNFSDGLNEKEIIQLSVLNSPQLRATQAQLQQSQAQLLQAGLLPDPQFNTSADLPRNGGPAVTTAYSFGLGFDLQALITRDAKKSAAIAQARSTYLQVLWQEWQIIQQARILYRRALIQQQQVALTHAQFLQTEQSWNVQEDALQHNNATLDAEGLARTSMMTNQSAWFEAQRQYNTTTHSLSLLLGLSPDIALPLVAPKAGLASMMTLSVPAKDLPELLRTMSDKRPDLLALQAGYQAQEANVRQQILAQFPSLSIGVNSLKDNANVWSVGPFINMSLPIFNRNRGNIALARATRARLQDEYHARVAAAVVQVSQLYSDQQLALNEWSALHEKLPDLDRLMQRMAQALAGGNVDMLTYTALQSSQFSQKIKALVLEQLVLEQAVALDTLLGHIQYAEPVLNKQQGSKPDTQHAQPQPESHQESKPYMQYSESLINKHQGSHP